MSHFGGASAVAGAAGSFIIMIAVSGCDAPIFGASAVLPFNGGLPAATGGAGRAACTGGLASIGGSVTPVTPVTAAIGRAAGRSATQSIPNTTLQSATASTAETAMNDFVRSEGEGNMEPSQRGDHTACSALKRMAGLK